MNEKMLNKVFKAYEDELEDLISDEIPKHLITAKDSLASTLYSLDDE